MRARLSDLLDSRGLTAVTLVHPSAVIAPETSLAAGCLVHANVYISSSVSLGAHCQVHYNATVGHDAILDDRVSVYPGANVAGSVHLAADVTVGSNAVVLDGSHRRAGRLRRSRGRGHQGCRSRSRRHRLAGPAPQEAGIVDRNQSTVARSPSEKGIGSRRGNRVDSRLLSAWECGTSPARGGRCTRGSGRPRTLSSSSISPSTVVRVPKARFTGPEAHTWRRTASVITLVTLPMKVKSRLWVPSPFTGIGRSDSAASMKTGTTAAYACPAGCRGPNTLKNRSASTDRPKHCR